MRGGPWKLWNRGLTRSNFLNRVPMTVVLRVGEGAGNKGKSRKTSREAIAVAIIQVRDDVTWPRGSTERSEK